MAVNLSPVGGAAAQFFDNSGQVLTGGKLYTYGAGTTTPAVTYTTNAGITAHSNPIILNAAGRVPDSGEIWLTDGILYKFVLKDQNDVLIATWDNISGINSSFIAYTGKDETQTATQGQTIFTLTTMEYQPATNSLAVYVNGSKQIITLNYTETSSTVITFVDGLNVGDVVEFNSAETISTNATDAANVAYNEGCPDAVNRTVESKLQESISVKDFGAVGDGTTDDTDAFNAAILCAGDAPVLLPGADFLVTSSLNASNARLVWDRVTVDTGLTAGYGYDQTQLPLCPPMTYGAGQRFIQSFRNSKVTGYDIYGAIYPSVESYDGLQGVTEITSGSTIENATGVAGYVQNNSTGSNGVCLSGIGQAVAPGGNVWGLNTLIQDSNVRAANTDAGKTLIGYECDINIMSPNTNVIGMSIGGNSLSNTTQGIGYVVNGLGTGMKWSVGFITIDGVADIGLKIGSSAASGASVNGQRILLGWTDSTSAQVVTQIQQGGSGFLTITSTSAEFQGLNIDGGNIYLQTGSGLWNNGMQVVGSRVTGWGSPSGATTGTFNATTATPAQTASFLAGIILALETHGLIGA